MGLDMYLYGYTRGECQSIPLTSEDLRRTAKACENRRLPHTVGFFFGESSWTYEQDPKDQDSSAALRAAADWLDDDPARVVVYRASW